ncbi:MAG: diacylglycerol kinase family protein [Patescibacteria group bacterium]
MISPRTFFRSLRHALRGLRDVARSEHSFRVQLLAATVALVLAFVFPLAVWQRIVVMLLSAAVLVLEVMNTIVERLADAVAPRLSHIVREVKDMMAGTVLLVSITSAVVGVIIFLPFVAPLLTTLFAQLRTVLY